MSYVFLMVVWFPAVLFLVWILVMIPLVVSFLVISFVLYASFKCFIFSADGLAQDVLAGLQIEARGGQTV